MTGLRLVALAVVVGSLAAPTARAISIATTTDIAPSGLSGVTVQQLRLSGPATDAYVVRADLCVPGVRIDATSPATSLRTAGSWASGAGAKVALNVDIY
ncbi:MAG: hypothetical protein FJ137_12280 [Deltaproteobacteria bacterium]|nr:hypothetical protein [Deltaproteobacteria bacterium]